MEILFVIYVLLSGCKASQYKPSTLPLPLKLWSERKKLVINQFKEKLTVIAPNARVTTMNKHYMNFSHTIEVWNETSCNKKQQLNNLWENQQTIIHAISKRQNDNLHQKNILILHEKVREFEKNITSLGKRCANNMDYVKNYAQKKYDFTTKMNNTLTAIINRTIAHSMHALKINITNHIGIKKDNILSRMEKRQTNHSISINISIFTMENEISQYLTELRKNLTTIIDAMKHTLSKEIETENVNINSFNTTIKSLQQEIVTKKESIDTDLRILYNKGLIDFHNVQLDILDKIKNMISPNSIGKNISNATYNTSTHIRPPENSFMITNTSIHLIDTELDILFTRIKNIYSNVTLETHDAVSFQKYKYNIYETLAILTYTLNVTNTSWYSIKEYRSNLLRSIDILESNIYSITKEITNFGERVIKFEKRAKLSRIYGDGSGGNLADFVCSGAKETNWIENHPSTLQFNDCHAGCGITTILKVPSGTVIRCRSNFNIYSTTLSDFSIFVDHQPLRGRPTISKNHQKKVTQSIFQTLLLRNPESWSREGFSGRKSDGSFVPGGRGGGSFMVFATGTIKQHNIYAFGEQSTSPAGGGAGGLIVLGSEENIEKSNIFAFGGNGFGGGGGGGGGVIGFISDDVARMKHTYFHGGKSEDKKNENNKAGAGGTFGGLGGNGGSLNSMYGTSGDRGIVFKIKQAAGNVVF